MFFKLVLQINKFHAVRACYYNITTILVQYLQAAFERVIFGKVLVFLKIMTLLIYSYFDCSSSAVGRLTILLPNHYLASKSASLQQISF